MQVIPHLYLSALQTLPFLVTLVGLYLILWKPLLQYMDERQQASAGARAQAHQLTAQVETRLRELAERLHAARVEAAAVRAEARKRAQAQEHQLLGQARDKADGRVSEALAKIRTAQVEASQGLPTMAASLSTDIATQVLGRAISA